MRAVSALLRVSAPSRALIVAVLLVFALCARLLALGTEWHGSTEHGISIIVLELVVLPVFAAMLGGALVRGEHAGWAWGFARPIARLRWVGAIAALDAVTLGLAAYLLHAVLGPLPALLAAELFRVLTLDVFPRDVYAPLAPSVALIAYLGAAVGAARGHSAVRGLPAALAWVAFASVTASFVAGLDGLITRPFVIDTWHAPARSGLLVVPDGIDAYLIDHLLGLTFLVAAVVGGCAHVVVHAITRLPGLVPRRRIAAIFLLWSICAAAMLWSLRSRLWTVHEAPMLARRGDADLWIWTPATNWKARWQSVVLAEPDCRSCFARVAEAHSDRQLGFYDVEPGRYELCRRFESTYPLRHPPDVVEEACVTIDLVAGEQSTYLDVTESLAVEVPPRQNYGYDRDDPFQRWVLLRLLWGGIERLRAPDDTVITNTRRGAP